MVVRCEFEANRSHECPCAHLNSHYQLKDKGQLRDNLEEMTKGKMSMRRCEMVQNGNQFNPDSFNLSMVLAHQYGNRIKPRGGTKRIRRRPDEVQRMFYCIFSGCDKSYGTISHLNTHRRLKNHGPPMKMTDFTNVKK
eukprot:NODE_414_length_7911_cov_0.926011.p6 type:complete len:138 gc:universal NODE_414_length_7911_cov_0.926011:4241-3828(-)